MKRRATWRAPWGVLLLAAVLGSGLFAWQRLRPPAPSQPTAPGGEAAAEGVPAVDATGPVVEPPSLRQEAVTGAVTERGIAIRITQRPALREPAPPYGAAYRELLPLAEAGDAAAQYRLGAALQFCRDTPEDAATLDAVIDRMHQTRELDGWPVDDPTVSEKLLRASFESCEGVPQAARADGRRWVKTAADAGLLEAQLRLMFMLPKSEYCQFLWQCSPQQRAFQEELQREALYYLDRARAAGSAEALWTFGHWYTSEEVLPRDDVEAYAHFRALDQIMAASGGERRHARMVQELRSRLRPVDLERGEARADELLSNPLCCQLTP